MVTKKLGLKRLEKLRDWMRGKGSGREFDFRTYEDTCGTVGCLAGELPYLFPNYWGFSSFFLAAGKFIFLKERPKSWKENKFSTKQPIEELAYFFSLSLIEVKHLFIPYSQSSNIDPYYKERYCLVGESTKKEVLENLERFIKIKKDEEIKKRLGKVFRKYGEERRSID